MQLAYFWSKFFKKLHCKALRKSKIDKTSKVEAGSELYNVSMGRHSFCGYNCEIINCQIGSFCSIANHVVIGGGMHPMDWVSMSPVFYEGRDSVRAKFSEHKRNSPQMTIIGHDVWIGHSAIIKAGVTIGNGAVVGMGSIVTKNVPPYAIVAGNPARLIRFRFDQETINGILDSAWWNFSDNELERFAQYFNDPKKNLSRLK